MLRVLILSLFLVISISSSNAQTLSDVSREVDSGNYQEAESIARTLIHYHPDDPRIHYILGQVYAIEGKHSMAYDELKMAGDIDRSLSFATDKRQYANMLSDESRYSGEFYVSSSTISITKLDDRVQDPLDLRSAIILVSLSIMVVALFMTIVKRMES